MNRKIINFVDMLKAVLQFFTEHPELEENNPALKKAIEKLKTDIAEFATLDKAQVEDTQTPFTLKNETKTSLIQKTLKVCSAIKAHAASINDNALKLSVDFTNTDFDRMRDHVLLQEVRTIYEIALLLKDKLTIWNTTENDIEVINTSSDTFETKDPAIKNIKSRTKQATEELDKKQLESRAFLKNTLDIYMEPLKFSDATLYGHYTKARTIVNIAAGHSKAKAKTDNTSTTSTTESK